MRRRDVLYGIGLSALSLGPQSRVLAASLAPATMPDLSASVLINGKQLDYHASSGQDLGDFQGQNFVQRCIRVVRPDSALTVFFRPDRTGDRLEVVFELGRTWGAANRAAAHLGPYKAAIRRGSDVVATVDVPNHWWFSRWRWQSAPRPVIATPEQLIAAKLLPPYSRQVAKNAPTLNTDAIVYKGPMDNAGVVEYVGTTGDRPDIGPVTEYQAAYILSGDQSALKALLAQAEAAGSMPMHVRDENTGAPVDFFQYPKLSWYYQPEGDLWVRGQGSIRDAAGHDPCPWTLNSSHDPALNYLPYLLTGDPYFLEELQFQGNQLLGETNYHRTKFQIVYPGETRSFAWSIRTIFQLARVAPATVPHWLKPRAYWKHILDDNRAYFTQNFVGSKALSSTVFHAATNVGSIAAWEEDFLAFALGWGVWMGFAEWRPAYLWKLQATLARTNGKSGWSRQWCTPYYYKIGPNPPAVNDPATLPAATWFKDWSSAWDAFRSNPENHVPESFSDQVSWQQPNSADYLIYTRGVLALANVLGIAEASEPFQFVDNMVQLKGYMSRRWAFAASA
jgi:hypothetical protein